MVRKREKNTPRKEPRQARSQATVDAILEAAATLLVRDGWEGFTTNRVADRAGVNIASLYQYFPNKEAIVVELQRRHVGQARQRFPDAVGPLRAAPSLHAMLGFVVEAAVAEHRVAPALHRIFAEELPRSVRPASASSDAEVERFWMDILEPFAKGVPDLALAAFIARVTLHAIVHEAAAQKPALLDDPRLPSEIVALLTPYLQRRVSASAPRTSRRRKPAASDLRASQRRSR